MGTLGSVGTKTTVNQVCQIESYPLPKIEELFANLSGGKVFSKLDLQLDDKSKQYVVINSHKGLFRYNRLPFGVSSAPAIFQCTMESLLQDIPGVAVYIDDILVSGKTGEEYLRTLEHSFPANRGIGAAVEMGEMLLHETFCGVLGPPDRQ